MPDSDWPVIAVTCDAVERFMATNTILPGVCAVRTGVDHHILNFAGRGLKRGVAKVGAGAIEIAEGAESR